jgi:hypothetical protein
MKIDQDHNPKHPRWCSWCHDTCWHPKHKASWFLAPFIQQLTSDCPKWCCVSKEVAEEVLLVKQTVKKTANNWWLPHCTPPKSSYFSMVYCCFPDILTLQTDTSFFYHHMRWWQWRRCIEGDSSPGIASFCCHMLMQALCIKPLKIVSVSTIHW